MKPEQAVADVELRSGDKVIKLKGLVDTDASRSVISKRLSEKLDAFIRLKEPYNLKTADKEGKLRISGFSRLDVTFQGVKMPVKIIGTRPFLFMPRTARIVIPNFPHHILNRANNKEIIFFGDEDFKFFLRQAKKYKQKFGLKIYHYCVMPNHYHFLIEPSSKESLVGFMQALILVYAQYVQRKYGKVGHIWQERYKSPVLEKEDYLARCGYYILRIIPDAPAWLRS